MSTTLHRIAAGVLATMFTAAFASATPALAEILVEAPGTISTTCGAGTNEWCSTQPVTQCSWVFDLSYNPTEKGFGIKIGRNECKVVGSVPIYKNIDDKSVFSGSCDLLAVFLGMPKGAGCS
jgi:hypothetical protein